MADELWGFLGPWLKSHGTTKTQKSHHNCSQRPFPLMSALHPSLSLTRRESDTHHPPSRPPQKPARLLGPSAWLLQPCLPSVLPPRPPSATCGNEKAVLMTTVGKPAQRGSPWGNQLCRGLSYTPGWGAGVGEPHGSPGRPQKWTAERLRSPLTVEPWTGQLATWASVS